MVKDEANTVVGTPFVEGAEIEFEPVKQIRTKKIKVRRFKAKVNYHRKNHTGYVTPFCESMALKRLC